MSSSSNVGVSEVVIPDPNARPPNVLGVSWSVGNKILVYPQNNPKNRDSGTASALRSPGLCHFVTWETSLYGPVMRKLVNESAGAFLSLQKMGLSGNRKQSLSPKNT